MGAEQWIKFILAFALFLWVASLWMRARGHEAELDALRRRIDHLDTLRTEDLKNEMRIAVEHRRALEGLAEILGVEHEAPKSGGWKKKFDPAAYECELRARVSPFRETYMAPAAERPDHAGQG